jgi:hypothetical protein
MLALAIPAPKTPGFFPGLVLEPVLLLLISAVMVMASRRVVSE